ncbi:hypothetical protein DL769_000678 [Monosporascus sp. CRB-8-3]|nr:hypothetical protein DL769_000678 [Monosporascus sp. CRB-8-3]
MPKAAKAQTHKARPDPLAKPAKAAAKQDHAESAAPSSINYVIRAQLKAGRKSVTRTLSVPESFTFYQLSRVLMVAFGWSGYHLSQFDLSGPKELFLLESVERWEEEPWVKWMKDFTLKDIFDSAEYAGKEIVWEYDLGMSWEHKIRLERKEERRLGKPGSASSVPVVCLSGRGRPMPEEDGDGRGVWNIDKVNETLRELFTEQEIHT